MLLPIDLASPRIKLIDLPAIDSSTMGMLTIRAELDVVPSDGWLGALWAALALGSERLQLASPRHVEGGIEFDSDPAHARDLCDELRVLVEATTRQHAGLAIDAGEQSMNVMPALTPDAFLDERA